VASLSQGRTAAAQCGLFTHKSVPVIFEPPCITLQDWSPSLLPAQPWTSMSAEHLLFLTKRNYQIQRFAITKCLHEYVFTVLAYKPNFKTVFFLESGHTIGKSLNDLKNNFLLIRLKT